MSSDRIEWLVGRVPTKITVGDLDQKLKIDFLDGSTAIFYHSQECCECVDIEDITGEFSDLIGHPLLVAEERVQNVRDDEALPPGIEGRNISDTWTFYTFRGVGGSVDVRWHGSSSGYYSETVDLVIFDPKK